VTAAYMERPFCVGGIGRTSDAYKSPAIRARRVSAESMNSLFLSSSRLKNGVNERALRERQLRAVWALVTGCEYRSSWATPSS
jgi:hypothetical protein